MWFGGASYVDGLLSANKIEFGSNRGSTRQCLVMNQQEGGGRGVEARNVPRHTLCPQNNEDVGSSSRARAGIGTSPACSK